MKRRGGRRSPVPLLNGFVTRWVPAESGDGPSPLRGYAASHDVQRPAREAPPHRTPIVANHRPVSEQDTLGKQGFERSPCRVAMRGKEWQLGVASQSGAHRNLFPARSGCRRSENRVECRNRNGSSARPPPGSLPGTDTRESTPGSRSDRPEQRLDRHVRFGWHAPRLIRKELVI
jgi:hypothetical protein